MSDAVMAAFGVTDADLLGSGWESTVYALGATQILRIPRPEAGSEDQVRARAAFTASLPLCLRLQRGSGVPSWRRAGLGPGA